MNRQFLAPKQLIEVKRAGSCSDTRAFSVHNAGSGIFSIANSIGDDDPDLSKRVCESIGDFLENEAGDRDATLPFAMKRYLSQAENVLLNAFVYANSQIVKKNEGKKRDSDKVGASAISMYLDGCAAAFAGIGLAEVYLFRGGECVNLVRARSFLRLRNPFHYETEQADFAQIDLPLDFVGISTDFEPQMGEALLGRGDWLLMSATPVSYETRLKLGSMQLSDFPISEHHDALEGCIGFEKNSNNHLLSLIIF